MLMQTNRFETARLLAEEAAEQRGDDCFILATLADGYYYACTGTVEQVIAWAGLKQSEPTPNLVMQVCYVRGSRSWGIEWYRQNHLIPPRTGAV